MNADTSRRLADLAAKLPKQLSDDDYASMADAQARADSVYQAFGKSAPRPLDGEDLMAYHRRLATGLKRHSRWNNANLAGVHDPKAIAVIAEEIYADALDASTRPDDVAPGKFRMITTSDPSTGAKVNKFFGGSTIFKLLSQPSKRVTNFMRLDGAGFY